MGGVGGRVWPCCTGVVFLFLCCLFFLNTGWVVVEENTQETICSWKSIPADKYCDMEKDKGCKLTVPDKIGEEKIYLLEK